MKNKGQALLEFIVILPLIVLIIFFLVDLGNIMHKKIYLENNIVAAEKGFFRDENVVVKTEVFFDYKEITLVYETDFITPGLDFVFDKKIETSMRFYNE